MLETERPGLSVPIQLRPRASHETVDLHSSDRIGGLAQGVINAGAMLLVLAAASVYTGSLRKRLAQQNQFIQQRGEALAAVEARLRQSFAATRLELEARIQAQQTELAELQTTLGLESQARMRAEHALCRVNSGLPGNHRSPPPVEKEMQSSSSAHLPLHVNEVSSDAATSPERTVWPEPLRYDLGCIEPVVAPAKLARKRYVRKTRPSRSPLAANS
jgi:hypothetical protein